MEGVNLKSIVKAQAQTGPGELAACRITIGFLGTRDMYKSLKAIAKSFFICGTTF
jgi:hypothetical protein